jgi:hypothetical protein
MYALSEKQIEFILNDIKHRGVEMEDLQLNLLDHICCVIECELQPDGDFESFYQKTIPRFFKKELKEIEEETILLLTFKNYYAMKKSMIISGTISAIMLIMGSFFKIMHWPGAGILLVLGITISSVIFLPLMSILKSKEISTKTDKLIIVLGTIVGILFANFVMFKVMHWPGANVFLFSSISIAFFIFLPIYFFTGIRKPEARVNTITSSVLLVMIIGLQFTLINTRPASKQVQVKMNNHVQAEILLSKMQQNLIDSSVTKKIADDINATCEQIKSLIIENGIGLKAIPKDFEEQSILLEEGNLGDDFFDKGEGLKLFSDLKKDLLQYNELSKLQVPIEQSILNIELEKVGLYNNYSVLNSITQLQMYIANAERG